MVGRFVAGGILFSAALAFLLLFGSGSSVDATTFKIVYEGSLSCAGPDGTLHTPDDSCAEDVTYGARGAGLTADMVSTFNIPLANPKHSNFSILTTMGTPDTWKLATDKELPNGAYVGTLTAQSTLALFGGICNTNLVIPLPMHDCTTDNFEGVNDGCPAVATAESGFHCNDSEDNDGDTTINDGCPKVATNDDADGDTVANDGCPAVAAAETGAKCLNDADDDGDTVANDGCPQVGGFAESGAECVDAESGANCANDTDDDADADPIIAWDIAVEGNNLVYGHQGDQPDGCTKYPQHVNSIMEGLRPRARYMGFSNPLANMRPTQVQFMFFSTEEESARGNLPYSDMGEATGHINQVITDNPPVRTLPGANLDEFCTPLTTSTNLLGVTGGEGELSQDVPPIATPAGSFWHVPVNETCGDGVDGDADTRTDEMCGLPRIANPAEGTGILATGSHLVKAYAESYRDADGDTINNYEDECPYAADLGADADGDRIDAVCDPDGDTGADQDPDGDGYRAQQDNCALVFNPDQSDVDEDRIGDACDAGFDDDGDGAPVTDVNEGCAEQEGCYPLGAAEANCDGGEIGIDCANAIDDDFDGVINDGCLAVGPAEAGMQCFNSFDDDGDTSINDGCPAAALDHDNDTYVNDGCAGATAETLLQCLDGPHTPDGHYLNDFTVGSVCIEEADSDGDGWCDSTETALGSAVSTTPEGGTEAGAVECSDAADNDGDTFTDGADAGCKTPESYVVDMTINAAQNPPGAGPQSCTNYTYYDVNQSHPAYPHQNGAGSAVDDDGDTKVNSTGVAAPGWCVGAVDDDADTNINDGCKIVGIRAENPACVDSVDDLEDVVADAVNDGCPPKGPAEVGAQCANNFDDDGDTRVNDGCPTVGANPESPECANAIDDDGDGVVNDGCPVKGVPETSPPDDGCTCPGDDADCDGVADGPDNCDNDYNPSQLDTDGDGIGDACDDDDDQDKTKDVDEWKVSSDPKNVCDPADFDLNTTVASKGVINILDVLMFSNAIMGQPCKAPTDYSVCEPIYRDP